MQVRQTALRDFGMQPSTDAAPTWSPSAVSRSPQCHLQCLTRAACLRHFPKSTLQGSTHNCFSSADPSGQRQLQTAAVMLCCRRSRERHKDISCNCSLACSLLFKTMVPMGLQMAAANMMPWEEPLASITTSKACRAGNPVCSGLQRAVHSPLEPAAFGCRQPA